MCGIVGLVSKQSSGFFQQTETSFFQMLYADALRGEDSTGIIGVERDSTFHIAKEACSADYFMWSLNGKEHNHIKTSMYNRGKAYIGHNRKRTQGAISDENAHPFVVDDNFAMVHNGTLTSYEHLAKGCTVDSEALAIHLRAALLRGGDSMTAIKNELDDALGSVYGAYAVAMYDQKTHRVYLLRNKERPLALFEQENGWYFMSEPLMGAWVLSRNNYDYSKMKALPVEEHMLHMFDLDGNTTKLYKEQLEPKKPKAPNHNNSGSVWGGSSHRGFATPMRDTSATAANEKDTTQSHCKGKKMEGEKNLKKFRNAWLGKRVNFWVDDYLEANIGKTVDGDGESKVTLMAGHEDIEYWHTILADVDLHTLGIRYSEDIGRSKWSGVIGTLGLTKGGVIQIYVDGAKPMVESSVVLQLINNAKDKAKDTQVQNAKDFKDYIARLLESELDTLYEEKKHVWKTWQISAANAERSFRAGIKTIERAGEICKDVENGFILQQKEQGGHFVYVGATGRIYYESSITIH